jgi:hypothetical protein
VKSVIFRRACVAPAAIAALLAVLPPVSHANARRAVDVTAANRVAPGDFKPVKPLSVSKPAVDAERGGRVAVENNRASAPVVTASGVATGQAGYIHYFLLTLPDGTLESAVGIELDDQRIAWALPEFGVFASPFIESGELAINGRIYGVQHRFGIRPFPDPADMKTLRAELARRAVPWVDAETPHCDVRSSRADPCVSCLGFVLNMLFPGKLPNEAAVPRDMQMAPGRGHYTTEDLLLYLAGLHAVPGMEARLRRIETAALPDSLRDELMRLVNGSEDARPATATAGKPPLAGRRVTSRGTLRAPAPRRL